MTDNVSRALSPICASRDPIITSGRWTGCDSIVTSGRRHVQRNVLKAHYLEAIAQQKTALY